MHPGNPWDLKGYRQMSGESFHDYIWRFSQKCRKLPSVADIDVISAFWNGTTYRTLVHLLSHKQQ
jgi:hypothetical protein